MDGYDKEGPFSTKAVHTRADVAPSTALPITLTFPKQALTNGTDNTLWPLVMLINGFKAHSSWYTLYASRLASYGIVCMQYDTPRWGIIPDSIELGYIPKLVHWLTNQHSIDTARIAIAGHSRGAKLAALSLCAHPTLFHTAVLLDPVDNTSRTPEGPLYPSACRALAACARPVCVVGAAVTGPCSPEGSNYRNFYAAVPPGSMLATLCRSGHTQLYDAGCILNTLTDWLCKKGGLGRKATLSLSVPLLVAWIDRVFTTTPTPTPHGTPTHTHKPHATPTHTSTSSKSDITCSSTTMQNMVGWKKAWFDRWVEKQESAGVLRVETKQPAGVPPDVEDMKKEGVGVKNKGDAFVKNKGDAAVKGA